MSRNKLLVIDDELGPRESLRFLFKDIYEVTCADSVDKGVAALKENPPDCIITDIKMPGKTGIQGLKEIRAIDQQGEWLGIAPPSDCYVWVSEKYVEYTAPMEPTKEDLSKKLFQKFEARRKVFNRGDDGAAETSGDKPGPAW